MPPDHADDPRPDHSEAGPFALEREVEDIQAPIEAEGGSLVATGDGNGAVKHFMRNAVGIPAPLGALFRLMPMWRGLRATGHTLPYDWAALGKHRMYGAPLDAEEFTSITMPTLVVSGSKSSDVLQGGSRALAEVLPNAELRKLDGVSHNVKTKKLAPVLAEFFTGDRRSARMSQT